MHAFRSPFFPGRKLRLSVAAEEILKCYGMLLRSGRPCKQSLETDASP